MHYVSLLHCIPLYHSILLLHSRERTEKVADIRQNIKESIVVILSAMQELGIELEHEENKEKMDYILQEAAAQEPDISEVRIVFFKVLSIALLHSITLLHSISFVHSITYCMHYVILI